MEINVTLHIKLAGNAKNIADNHDLRFHWQPNKILSTKLTYNSVYILNNKLHIYKAQKSASSLLICPQLLSRY